MRRYLLSTVCLFVSLAAVGQQQDMTATVAEQQQSKPKAVAAQQQQIKKFHLFVGSTVLTTPSLGLTQKGVHFQGGVALRRWLEFGVDYAYFGGGSSNLTPSLFLPSVQTGLGQLLQNPGFATYFAANPNYKLSVPYSATTWELAFGPQVNITKFKKITPFFHPDLGMLKETVTVKPRSGDLPAIAAVNALLPSGKASDLVPYYGVGLGFNYNVSKRFAFKVHYDFVHCKVFDNLLADSRNSSRISFGPIYNFGPDVK